MAVCQFFLRGSCKFGDQCRNEHPQGGQGDRRSALGGSSWTPSNPPKTIPFSLETMTKDFDVRADKPSWSLSSYGPAKNEKNLLPPLDESPEELRLKAVTAMRSGNINEYLQYEQNALAKAEQIFSNARNDIKGAFEAAKRQSLGTDAPSNTTSAFTGTAPGSGSAFSAGGVSAFGNPSVFGAQNSASTSPFGQPQGTSAFGASAFGAPAFGQPPVPKSNFGAAPTNSGGFSAFAGPGPSAFATAANNPSAATGSVFGQSAFSGTGGAQQPQSAIGTANPAPTSSAFGRPGAFGSTAGSVFGQPSPFGVASSPTSAFGQPTSTSTFGQTSTASSNPLTTFGQPAPTPSAFSQPTSAFGQPLAAASTFSQPTTTTSAFGQQAAHTSPFGVATQQSAFGQVVSPSKSSAAPNSQAKSVGPDFSNAKTTYKPGLNPYDALLPANYSSLLPESVRDAFAAPRFTWGNVPDWIPPLDMR